MEVVAVTDRKQSVRPFLEQVELIASAGVDMVVLREKDLDGPEYAELTIKVKEICDAHGVRFCINSFVEVAEDIGTEYLWIPYAYLKEKGRPRCRKVGVSVHSEAEAYDASDRGADFVIYGNVFETTCKPGLEGKGFDEIRRISVNSDIPVYAIGGIDVGNMQQVHDCLVDGICMMSGFMRAEDPAEIVKFARSLLD